MNQYPARMLRCSAIGECMIELRSLTPASLALAQGGDTFNTLYYLAALLRGSGGRFRYLTALGDDDLSARMRAEWQAWGIDTSLVQTKSGKLPGIYRISTDSEGERRFHYWRRDSAAGSLMEQLDTEALVARLRSDELVYFSGISLAILPASGRLALLEALRACAPGGPLVAFDDNYRPVLWESPAAARDALQLAFQLADIAFVSFADQQTLFGDAAPEQTMQRIRGLGVPELVVRNGAAPSLVASAQGLQEYQPPEFARALDTTGAGDSFSAAYLAARLCGCEPLAALRAANGLSALVVGVPGALMPQGQVPALGELLAK